MTQAPSQYREGLEQLTAKEKETLRLMARGHDAKSMAMELSRSVHTINERLRVARRKLDVTSSREAARLLLESEAGPYENSVYDDFRDAPPASDSDTPPTTNRSRNRGLIIGGIVMFFITAALLLSSPLMPGEEGSQVWTEANRDQAIEAAAEDWLALLDARDWQASYDATAQSFREANTLTLWRETATGVQGRLGETVSRKLIGTDDVPSPQEIVIVKYRTDYANRTGAIETVSMVQEDGIWKVAGIYVS